MTPQPTLFDLGPMSAGNVYGDGRRADDYSSNGGTMTRGSIDDVLAGRATWCAEKRDGFALARLLGAGAVDHVIGDPPYDEHTHNSARTTDPNGKKIDLDIDFDPLPPVDSFAPSLVACARRWVICFCAVEQIGAYACGVGRESWVRGGIWVRTDGTPQISGDRPAQGAEGIAIMHRAGPKRWNRGGHRGVWTGPICREPGRMHPTKKPRWLMEALIRDFTDPGDLILDPTMGEGTTGEAALALGRRFIGCEIADGIDPATGKHDPKRDYFAAAVRRLERADARPKQAMLLGTDPAPRMKQAEMFGGKA